MGFSCGIVGLPNVGKSTIFNALSKAQNAESANYPFCTIDPNRGVIPVPDERMNFIIQYIKPKSIVPTTVEFVDIAGLVKGASHGEGRGNQFLTHIRQTDAVAHVVRCFENDEIVHVENKVDPANDIEIINTELLLADMEILDKAVTKHQKAAKSGDKALKKKVEVLEEFLKCADEGKPLRALLKEHPEYIDEIREYNFITIKPVLYVANVDEDALAEDNEHVKTVRQIASSEGAEVVKICGKTECELQDLSEEEAKEYLQTLGMERSGLDSLIKSGYDLLGLITFFTAGEKEVRAWTVENGASAPQAAGKIHSDIERGFIRAEVCSYADFEKYKSLTTAKENGRLRLEGKDYVVQDGGIMYSRFNV